MLLQGEEIQVNRENVHINSSDGQSRLHVRIREVSANPVCCVQIIHGLAEHIGRYEDLMAYLNARGINCYGDDHIGHGQSEGPWNREVCDLGSYEGRRIMVDDEAAVTRMIRRRVPAGTPLILLGHSMGSLILRDYLCRYAELLDPQQGDRAIIMGTGYMSPAQIALLSSILGFYTLSGDKDDAPRLLNQLTLGQYNRRFKPLKTEVDWLSANVENCERYIKDPDCGKATALSTFTALRDLMNAIGKDSALQKMNPDLPVLFVSGADDAFGDFSAGPRKVCRQFKRAGMKNTRIKIYPGMRHEILNEKDCEQVYEDLLSFMSPTSVHAGPSSP